MNDFKQESIINVQILPIKLVVKRLNMTKHRINSHHHELVGNTCIDEFAYFF